jgi:hypothetical protein
MKMAPPADHPFDDASRQPDEGAWRENENHTSHDADPKMLQPVTLEHVSILLDPQYPRRQHNHA